MVNNPEVVSQNTTLNFLNDFETYKKTFKVLTCAIIFVYFMGVFPTNCYKRFEEIFNSLIKCGLIQN